MAWWDNPDQPPVWLIDPLLQPGAPPPVGDPGLGGGGGGTVTPEPPTEAPPPPSVPFFPPSPGQGSVEISAPSAFGGPIYFPGSGNLSERELARRLGEQPSNDVLAILGIKGIFRGTYRRPSTITVIRRAARVVISRAIDALRVVNVPEKAGLPIRVLEAAPRSIFPYIARLGGIVGGVLYPSSLSPNDVLYPPEVFHRPPDPRDLLPRERLRREDRDRVTDPFRQPGGQSTTPTPAPQVPRPPAATLPDPNFRGFIRKLAQGELADLTEELACEQIPVLCGPMRAQRERYKREADRLRQGAAMGPPMPTSSPSSPASSPTQINLPGSQTGSQTGAPPAPRITVRWGQIAGAIGAGLVIEALRPTTPIISSPITTESQTVTPQLPTPTVSPAPITATSAVFYGGSFSGSEYCTPAPRGPRRKCLERGPVKWSGGRRKGKSAGTKCIRFANRRT